MMAIDTTRANSNKHCLIALCLFLVSIIFYWNFISFYAGDVNDISQDYIAATMLRQGQSIYTPLTAEEMHELVGNHSNLNQHPPFTAVLLYPLSFFSFPTVFIAWNIFSLFLLQCLVLLISKNFGLSWQKHLFIGGLLLGWYPTVYTIGTAQWSVLISFLIVLAWHYSKREPHSSLAGIILAFTALLKLFPLLLVFPFLFSKKQKAIASYVATIIVFTFLTSYIVGENNFLHYFHVVAKKNSLDYLSSPINISFSSLFFALLQYAPLSLMKLIAQYQYSLSMACTAGITILYGICCYKLKNANENFDLAYMLGILLMILASPVSWAHGYTIMILPILWLVTKQNTFYISLFALLFLSIPDYPLWKFFESQTTRELTTPELLAVKISSLGIYMLLYALWQQKKKHNNAQQ